MMNNNNKLRQQIDYNEHENARKKTKLTSKLPDTWVADGIKLEECLHINAFHSVE